MLAAAIAGVCCVVVGAVLMTSAARSAATTVPVAVGPGDSKVRSASATFTHKFVHAGPFGYHCPVHFGFGMVGSVKVPLMVTRSGSKVTVRWASSAPAAGFVEDVQQQKPGAASFTALVTGSTAQAKAITLARGTWKFRARYRNSASGKASGFSPVSTVTIT